ncbi:MAG TPA: hypothetical protein VIH89_14440 [Candidatus Sulfotelmatobacter sp.]|jgi:hypothetical protein
MSVQADIFVSHTDEEAAQYDSEPATFRDREQYTSFTELELSTLWAKIRDVEWDVDSLDKFHTVLIQNGGERIIKRLPKDMAVRLARLTPQQISIAAAKWAATDEMACNAADVQPIIEGLVRLAQAASETNRNIYFWNCV